MRIFACLISFFFLIDAYAFKAGPAIFHEIKSISESIAKRCPPPSCIVVGVGRSPTPFIAYLRQQYGDALNLPINSNGLRSAKYGSEAGKVQFLHYISKFFEKNSAAIAGKRIFLIDYVNSGDSVNMLDSLLSEYVNDKNYNTNVQEIEIMPLINENRLDYLKSKISKTQFQNIILVPEDLGSLLYHEYFDRYSEYESYNPIGNQEEAIPNSEKWNEINRWLKKNESIYKANSCLKSILEFITRT